MPGVEDIKDEGMEMSMTLSWWFPKISCNWKCNTTPTREGEGVENYSSFHHHHTHTHSPNVPGTPYNSAIQKQEPFPWIFGVLTSLSATAVSTAFSATAVSTALSATAVSTASSFLVWTDFSDCSTKSQKAKDWNTAFASQGTKENDAFTQTMTLIRL